MTINMGQSDRFFRVLLASAIGYLYFTEKISGNTGIFLMILSVVFVITSLLSYCPVYTFLGVNTCPRK